MDDAVPVCVLECLRHFDPVSHHRLRRHGFPLNQLAQRPAFDVLHGDEWQAAVIANLVDGADVTMVQRRGGARLAQERFAGIRRAPSEHFDRHRALQDGIDGAIDDRDSLMAPPYRKMEQGQKLPR